MFNVTRVIVLQVVRLDTEIQQEWAYGSLASLSQSLLMMTTRDFYQPNHSSGCRQARI